MFLLCGYRRNTYESFPKVYILGIYETLNIASKCQEELCGKITKSGKCWNGKNSMCTWIFNANTDKNGTLEKALDIRYTSEAIFVPNKNEKEKKM
tara:strand:+ start:255 stop:539 length:285 start_codon:yes stop_codon:yes gene_type:complete